MTIFNVHIYKEMRLVFSGIDADSHEAAAEIARDKLTEDADSIDDCEGETLSALIDVQGDEEYAQSRVIDFEGELSRKVAPKLLEALIVADGFVEWAFDHAADSNATAAALRFIRSTIAQAEAADVHSETSALRLLSALYAVLPYADNERNSLGECWRRDGDARVKEELDRCDRALAEAQAAIGYAPTARPTLDSVDVDFRALLAARHQIAAIWTIADVQSVRPDLSDRQAWEVLQAADRQHDASVGINWEVLQCHADWLFGDAPATAGTE
jgi:hypothetical protein